MTTFDIPVSYMKSLERELSIVEKKCKKYGCEFSYTRGEQKDITVHSTEGDMIIACVEVDVSGRAVINGWEYVAAITHVKDGVNLINDIRLNATFGEIPKFYRTSKCHCDHCNTNRHRNKTFLIRNIETGEFKQVGTKCVKEYTRGMDAEFIAAMSDLDVKLHRDDMSKYLEGKGSDDEELLEYLCGHKDIGEPSYAVENIVALSIDEIKRVGHYVPTGSFDESPTVHEVRESIRREIHAKEESVVEARKMIEWLNGQDAENSSYIYNAQTICKLGQVRYRDIGAVACIPAIKARADRETQKKAEKHSELYKDSQFVGDVKTKVTVKISALISNHSYETQFGISRVIKFADENGNVLTWFASGKSSCIEAGNTIIGTVKEHKVYDGCKETILTRCKAV